MKQMTEVVFFHAEWCGGCKAMLPTFLAVAKEYEGSGINIYDLDVETDKGVDMSTLYQVRSLPTTLIIKNERVVSRIVGSRTKDVLREEIEKWK